MMKTRKDEKKNFPLRLQKNSPEAKWLQRQKNSTESLTFLISLALSNYGNIDIMQIAKKRALNSMYLGLDTQSNEKNYDDSVQAAEQKQINEKEISLSESPKFKTEKDKKIANFSEKKLVMKTDIKESDQADSKKPNLLGDPRLS